MRGTAIALIIVLGACLSIGREPARRTATKVMTRVVRGQDGQIGVIMSLVGLVLVVLGIASMGAALRFALWSMQGYTVTW